MRDETDASVGPWTVTTWNVHGSEQPDLSRVAAALTLESPDVVLLQEIRRYQAASLAQLLRMRFSWARKHYPYTRLAYRWAEGLTIMTPHTIAAPGHAELSVRQPNSSWRRRIAQWSVVARGDGARLAIYNVHLSPHDDAPSRRSEALRLAEIVTQHGAHESAVIGGDFNDDRDATVIYTLPGIEHVTPPATNPAELPTQLLDHVLLPATATDVSVTVPAGDESWAEISDHLPVTVRFSLNPGGRPTSSWRRRPAS